MIGQSGTENRVFLEVELRFAERTLCKEPPYGFNWIYDRKRAVSVYLRMAKRRGSVEAVRVFLKDELRVANLYGDYLHARITNCDGKRRVVGWRIAKSLRFGGYWNTFDLAWWNEIMEKPLIEKELTDDSFTVFARWVEDPKNFHKIVQWKDVEKKKGTRFQDYLADQIPGLFKKQTKNKP